MVARYRVAYRQDGPARWVGHLDIMRAFARAARRARLPLSYTQGFNPRPRLSFAAPLPVGMKGHQEYADLELEEELPVDEVSRRLRWSLPPGLQVLRVRRVPDGGPALMSILDRARYVCCGPLTSNLTPAEVEERLVSFLNRGEILSVRREGEKPRDIRPGIKSVTPRINDGTISLAMELKAGSHGSVRPEELLYALREFLPIEPASFTITRTALIAKDGKLLWDC